MENKDIVAVYKQASIVVSIDGLVMDSIAEEDSITITYDRARVTKQNDTDTGGIFSYKNGKPAKVTIPVLIQSRWNFILSNYKNTGEMLELSIIDRNGYSNGITLISPYTMVLDPDISFGTDAESRKYVFEVMHMSDVIAPIV